MSAKLLQLCPAVCDPVDCSLPGSSVHGVSPGKSIGVGCHGLLQGIFPTQGSNPCLLCLLHQQADSLPLVPPGKSLGHIRGPILACDMSDFPFCIQGAQSERMSDSSKDTQLASNSQHLSQHYLALSMLKKEIFSLPDASLSNCTPPIPLKK